MKSPIFPRRLFILILVLVGLAFLVGTVRLANGARAAAASPAGLSRQELAIRPPLIRLGERLEATAAPTESPKSTPAVGMVSADTTGIIALAFVIVATILVGAAWGARTPSGKKTSAK